MFFGLKCSMSRGYDRFKLLNLILFYESLGQNDWTVLGLRACENHLYCFSYTRVETFPFWAIKLYLLSDPDSKDENSGGGMASHQTSYHIWKFAQDINLGKTKITVHRYSLENA